MSRSVHEHLITPSVYKVRGYQWYRPIVWYVYPLWHKVSFTLIGNYHVQELKKYYRVYEIDELAFGSIDVYGKIHLIIHPYFFIATRYSQYFVNIIDKFETKIGIDVADSDMISKRAVNLVHYLDAIIVPSNFSKEAYLRSGVKIPVYVVPHGLSEHYFKPPRPAVTPFIKELREKKKREKAIYLLFFLIHSGRRKGAHLVYQVANEIQKMYNNVYLVLKVGFAGGGDFKLLSQLRTLWTTQWFSEQELVDLYDSCDIYLGFSTGGGFEKNFLEAISRGLPCIACNKGSWTDFLPDFLLVPYARRVKVFPEANPLLHIHCGYGYELDVEKAIDKLKDVIENLDEYKAKVKEYWNKIKSRYTWESIGKMLKQVLDKYIKE
ncbi:MAG: hypothetical protein DRP11_00885 [Candidatus Aenigmatarchaeota archaeon]|nr:MAG: hypothetical protein DRP11_00885 [Candidatus Aenigmarchaeota archaeon]